MSAKWVYWTIGTGVMKVPLGGGVPITVASGQSSPSGIALDGTNVYWTAGGDYGTVMKLAQAQA